MTEKNKIDLTTTLNANSLNNSIERDSNRWQNMQNKNYNWHPPTDVYETLTELVIKVEIAGMEESNFDITIDKNILVIRGNRIDKTNPEKKAYHQVEIGFGEFTTQIEINIPLDHENSSAQYDNGFLTIKIPKALPKQIKITKKD
jgi:HSP20 family protein